MGAADPIFLSRFDLFLLRKIEATLLAGYEVTKSRSTGI